MHDHLTEITSQPTYPIPVVASCSFHEYLNRYTLLWKDIAHAAGVPVLVVWSIDHGLSISSHHAESVRSALQTLTGVPFVGPIDVMKGK